VSVRIRMKKMGRPHRPFFRVCAMNIRSPRDGKVIEELGYYDPMVRDANARAILNAERITYWLSVGAQPSDKVAVLIQKYGPNGTHLEAQQAALEQMKSRRPQPPAPYKPPPKPEPMAEAGADLAATDFSATEGVDQGEAQAMPEPVTE
jgi:small subunit ribosomal protein S16